MAAKPSPRVPKRNGLPPQGMPEGEELQRQIDGRNRRAKIWLALFQMALLIAIVALLALLYNIINSTFGLVAVENAVDPDQLMTQVQEERMLAAPNTQSSEDDEAIAAAVAADAGAVGFFGFAYAQEHADTLKVLPIEGITPSAESVESGEYPLSRPLYIYVGRKALQSKPEVAAFVSYYLDNAASVIDEVGYFPAGEEAMNAARTALAELVDEDAPEVTEGTLRLGGSSTVFPLTSRLLTDFKMKTPFEGRSTLENAGTKAGFSLLCSDQVIDIANASRAMNRQESDFCVEMGVRPVELRVGSDAIAIVVSRDNTFVETLSAAEAQAIFSGAELWSDVNAAWPAQPIARVIPGAESGTLDFFAESAFSAELSSLTSSEIMVLLEANLSRGVLRRLNSEKPLVERTQAELYALLVERVVEPTVVQSWSLSESLLNRAEIEEATLADYPTAKVEWYSWINRDFLTSTQSSTPEDAGVRTAILGSLLVILITMTIAVPIGIGSAIYLEEYAGHSRLQQIIQTNIDNLAGVPSIIYGILGLAIFVRTLEPLTSGSGVGLADPTTANGRTILSAALTLALLVLPVVIINAQEAIRAVPQSLRQAGYGLGATKWQVTWTHVLNNALPGIFTGTILAMSRALGETAPLIVVGASTFITVDPTGPFSKFTVLPMQIYQWTSRPQAEFRHLAAAASLVLLVLLLLLNGSAIYMRNRFSKKL